jgi:hypothetical protein
MGSLRFILFLRETIGVFFGDGFMGVGSIGRSHRVFAARIAACGRNLHNTRKTRFSCCRAENDDRFVYARQIHR